MPEFASVVLSSSGRRTSLTTNTAQISMRESRHTISSRLSERQLPAATNKRLSDQEVEHTLRNIVKDHYQNLLKAFQTYDIDRSLSVTKGEFRRVLELFSFPFSNTQFQTIISKIGISRNNAIQYMEFLQRYNDESLLEGTPQTPINPPRTTSFCPAKDLHNLEMIEGALKKKISKNLNSFLKAIRLFDYNRDRKIQRHELRKVIENYVFPMKDQQFERLWQRHDYHHTGVIDYIEFLNRIGVHVNSAQSSGDRSFVLCAPTSTSNNQRYSNMTFEEVEKEFRRKMQECYRPLWKTCKAHNPSMDGFITIEELKSILNQFIMPLSDEMFSQLVDRTGLKATGKVPWLTFLQKFRDPQSASNGQTIPIKSSHKANPIRGTGISTTLSKLLDLLHNHVTNAYSSYRDAFLQLDCNRDGKITRRELRRLLDRFKLSISPEQFKELMIILDPQHTGFITYHHFLGLFEPKESESAHTWLTSVHRYNDKQAPTIMAWKALEDILAEKVTLNWRDFVNCISSYDTGGGGYISPEQLRKVVEKVVIPISKEHMDDIVGRLKFRDERGCVSYLEFLHLLGVDVRPLDTKGLSTQIMQLNQEFLQCRQSDHANRMLGIKEQMDHRTSEMSIVEIVTRLRDRMKQHKTQIRHAFVSMDKSRKGRITHKDFRQILESYGLTMGDQQFDELLAYLGFVDHKYLRYLDFLTYFDDPREVVRSHLEALPKSNHHVNPIRGDEHSMRAQDVIGLLSSKLRENFKDLRAAFYKFDETHQGYLTRISFRRLLDYFMCVINDEEFEKVCRSIRLPPNGKIRYSDFLERFEIRDDMERGHRWLESDHRFNNTKPITPKSPEIVHSALAPLVHQNHKNIARAFCHIDSSGKGCIRRKNFRQLLGQLNLPMEPHDFAQLWKKYDPDGRGAITYEAFLRIIGVGEQFASGDQGGPSERIINESHDTVMRQLLDQQCRQETQTYNQANLGSILEDEEVYNVICTRIRNDFKDPASAFRVIDVDQKGYLTLKDFEMLTNHSNIFLTDNQFITFCRRIGFKTPQAKLSYESFCKAFDLKVSGPERNLDSGIESETSSDDRTVEGAGQTQVEARLREYISEQIDIVRKAFMSFDTGNTGRIKAASFRRVIDNFCFRLTDTQFKELLKNLPSSGDNMIDYIAFLGGFQSSEKQANTEAESEMMQHNLQDQTHLTIDMDIEDKVRELVSTKLQQLEESFKQLDYANIGVVAKEGFKEILQTLMIEMSDQEFEMLWKILPVNEFGNLSYHEFLVRFGKVMVTPAQKSTPVITHVADSKAKPSNAIFGRKQVQVQHENEKESLIESKLQNCISRHWKSIHSKCKAIETNGEISVSGFIGVLRQSNCDIHPGDLVPHIERFGLSAEGTFCYKDFLRSFVLNADQEDHSDVKKKLTKAQIPFKSRDQSRDLFQCMTRIRHRVLSEWKNMRRKFREEDVDATGLVTAGQFRQTLNNFGISLSEDEFYHLMTHYDKNLSGRIDYNTFIKAFLLSA